MSNDNYFGSEDLFNFPEDDKKRKGEPSFSLYEFKKWLSDQKDINEDLDEQHKDELKEKFKLRFKNKVRKRKN